MTRQLLGTFFLTLAGYGLARIRLQELLRHATFLEAMANAFRRMRIQTTTLLQPLPEQILSESSRKTAASGFFRVLLKRYRTGVPFRKAWEDTIRQIPGLSEESSTVMLSLGEVLGSCAAETQSDALNYAADTLQNQANVLKAEAGQRGHLELRLFPILALTVAFLLW